MEKVDLVTADIAAENAAKLAELFPDIVTEVLDEEGNVRHSIDVEALKAHVGDIAEDKRERYQFTWPGKQRARVEAIRPIEKTMRPCPEESVNWDTTENLYIEGDNLDALKILRETYAGKIKMIYIDPPYNTGHDFVYNDSFARTAEEERAESGAFDEEGNVLDAAYNENKESNGRFHSDWCSMMYPRLVLARDLLSDDGAIFISCDDGEVFNLKSVCDEVFGYGNFLADIVWEKRFTRSNNAKLFASLYDHNLAYRRSGSLVRLRAPRTEKSNSIYSNPDNDPRGPWTSVSYVNPATKEQRPNLVYSIMNPYTNNEVNHPTHAWKYEKSRYEQHVRDGRLYWGQDGKNIYPRLKKYLSEVEDGIVPVNLWKHEEAGTTDAASKDLFSLLGVKAFDFPKPLKLICQMLGIACESDSLVLDFFSGSATTAHAVMQLNAEDGGNRKFIMVQLPEVSKEGTEAAKAGYKNICEIGKERIRRAGAKIVAEIEEANAQLKLGEEPKKIPDIGFRVLKIDSSNFEDVKRTPDAIDQGQLFALADNLKPDRTPEDILFQLFPQFQISYTARIETLNICGKTVYSVDDDTLLACFDRDVPEDAIRIMAARQPSRAVLRDASFVGDDALANFEEIFKTLSPETETRVV